MTLEQTAELYASVLRQLLPVGGYDASPNTEALSVDVYAHAKLLAQADLDAKRLLNVLEGIPSELINEYEAEYGLPLKCTVNASRTFEERLQILNWVHTSRNVLNLAYLEQLLAIFGVVLIDIVKFKPMQCTASCTSPVNTEQLRYKVFLRLQYPMNADMNCIVENYLPGYLRIEWMVDMPWGDWILNSSVAVNTNGIAHYTAYKTNQREYYDSYADLDLTDAIVRSLHDSDMQQWQAVKDACNELTGSTNWVFNNANETVEYSVGDPLYQYKTEFSDVYYETGADACNATIQNLRDQPNTIDVYSIEYSAPYCRAIYSYYNSNLGYTVTNSINAWINKYNRTNPLPILNITYQQVAQKIISNASSSNQATSLLAEAYIEAVANSIFNMDESKQFVKITDLTSKFESNKTLRT